MQPNNWKSAEEHPGEEVLERYSLGTLPEGELSPFEEHLLICPVCQERLAETDAYVLAVRTAAARLRKKHAAAWNPFPPMTGILTAPRIACALGVVLVALAIPWFAVHWSDFSSGRSSPMAVILQTARGQEGAAEALAPARTPLVLRIDLAQLPALPAYSVEIVTADGSVAGEYSAVSRDGNLSVSVDRRLAAGKYWVRLYAPEPRKELLREYGLEVKVIVSGTGYRTPNSPKPASSARPVFDTRLAYHAASKKYILILAGTVSPATHERANQ